MERGYKTELDPNNKQITLLKQHCGAARFTFNWGLARRIQEYKEKGKSSNAIEQHRQLNSLKKEEFPWMYDISKCSPQEALRDLDRAFQNFFRRCKKGEKPGFPKFKKKHQGKESFRLTGTIIVEPTRVKLPRLGWIRLKEHDYLPIGKPSQVTISERAGRWFISFITANEIKVPKITDGETIGIDLGLHKLATCSNGTVFDNPRSLKRKLKKLKRLQQRLSRRKKGSRNREKARREVAKLHFKISNIRKDAIHKATSSIVKTKPSKVVMEDLNVQGMTKNRKLARSIMDAAFYEFRRQMTYKLGWIGSEIALADRFYPSSKLCSHCGAKKDDLMLADREYICYNCGCVEDRDFNASVNLSRYCTASSAGTQACGEAVNPSIGLKVAS